MINPMQFDDSALGKVPTVKNTFVGSMHQGYNNVIKHDINATKKAERDTASAQERASARAEDIAHTANKEQVRQDIRTAGHTARQQATAAALGARSTAKINEMNAAGKNRVALEREKGRQQRSVLKAKGALEEKKAATKAAAAAPKPKATASKPRAPRKPAGPLIHTDTKGKITGYTHRSSATLPKPVSPSQATANVAKKRQTKPTA